MKLKIGILYITIGRYDIFFEEFYNSSQEYFLREEDKHYFVFTDSLELKETYAQTPQITFIDQKKLEWPYSTMLRFEIFLRIEEQIKAMNFDYLFFMNANLRFVSPINKDEFLPPNPYKLLACQFKNFGSLNSDIFSYDRNPLSKAYIPKGSGKYYVQGGLQGGKTTSFMEAVRVMDEWTKIDLANGVCALWHDESYWNKYILDRTDVFVLSPSYLYPEYKRLPYKKKIIIVDKGRKFGHDYLRGLREQPENQFKLYFKDKIQKFKNLINKNR